MIKTQGKVMKISLYLMMLIATIWQTVHAEQKVSQGQYEVHYNTFPATFLDSKVASTYQIKRSKSRGILSITVAVSEIPMEIAAVANRNPATIAACFLVTRFRTNKAIRRWRLHLCIAMAMNNPPMKRKIFAFP